MIKLALPLAAIMVTLPLGTVQQQSVLWSPEDITSISWWEASEGNLLTTGDNVVTQWLDTGSAGIYHLMQDTNLERMTNSTRTINGLNVIEGDATQWMEFENFPIPDSGNLAIFVVAEIDTTSKGAGLICMNADSNDWELAAKDGAPDTDFYGFLNVDGNIGNDVQSSGGPYNGPSLYNVNFDWGTSNYNIYIDGEQTATRSDYYSNKVFTNQHLKIFADRPDEEHPDGAIGEIIIIEDVTEATRQIVEGYAGHRWGFISNFTNTHPYYSSPP